jgi:predicted DNA repair protein MutK
VQYEQTKIKGAIRTDFILSAEIIVLTLGVVSGMTFLGQVLVVSIIAFAMTISVYGLVAGIVKLDDAGLYLMEKKGPGAWLKFVRWMGWRFIIFAPWLMKFLAVVGTVAMFMVGGGILVHGFHELQEGVQSLATYIGQIETVGPLLAFLTPTLCSILIGIVAGGLVLAGVTLWRRLRRRED